MLPRSLAVGVVIAIGGSAAAAPTGGPGAIVVRGEVTSATSRWTPDQSRIVTDAVIRSDDGSVTTVSELGGHADGLTMRTFPGPAPLATGMEVAVTVRRATTGDGREVLAVDDVDVVRDSFVRTGPTPSGHYLKWASGCAQVAIAEEGTRAIAGDGEFNVFEDVLATWNTGVAGCSYMNLVSSGKKHDHEVGNDGVNLLKFRDVTWCRPAVDGDAARCYSPTTAGLTTVVYIDDAGSDRDGEILDADVELNGVDFAISVNGVSLDNTPCRAELANTLTHEIGHLLGLEHTCLALGDPPRTDGAGHPVPRCDATTDPLIIDATMYNFQDCGEVKKESLTPDDTGAVCAVYPTADDPHECGSPGGGGGGCCDAGGSPAAPVALSIVIALALARPRRKLR